MFKYLLSLPIALIANVAILVLCSAADAKIADQSNLGHPAPAFTLLGILAIVVIDLAVLIFVIVRTVKALKAKRQTQKQ